MHHGVNTEAPRVSRRPDLVRLSDAGGTARPVRLRLDGLVVHAHRIADFALDLGSIATRGVSRRATAAAVDEQTPERALKPFCAAGDVGQQCEPVRAGRTVRGETRLRFGDRAPPGVDHVRRIPGDLIPRQLEVLGPGPAASPGSVPIRGADGQPGVVDDPHLGVHVQRPGPPVGVRVDRGRGWCPRRRWGGSVAAGAGGNRPERRARRYARRIVNSPRGAKR